MAYNIPVEDIISILDSRIELLAQKGPILGMTNIEERIEAIKKERAKINPWLMLLIWYNMRGGNENVNKRSKNWLLKGI